MKVSLPLFALTLLFAQTFARPAWAEDSLQLACSDETPTVGVVIREVSEDHKVVSELFAFQGMKALVPELADLPNYLRFEWDPGHCQKTEAFVVKCAQTNDVQNIEGHVVQADSIESFNTLDNKDGTEILMHHAVLHLWVDGKTYAIEGAFTAMQCSDTNVFSQRPRF